MYAGWFTQTLNGDCGVWVENGPGMGFAVDPNGGSYSCDFGALGWDLLPGQDVGVSYEEPDGDRVYNVFREPAPDMRIEKWAEGSGQVMPGGPAVFTLQYRNDGDADAVSFTITDTLPGNTTYFTDTSGVTPQFGPGTVSWTFGPLQPGYQGRFQIVLVNTANPDDVLTNSAEIFTLYDFNDGNDHAEAQVTVVDASPDLYVNKIPIPATLSLERPSCTRSIMAIMDRLPAVRCSSPTRSLPIPRLSPGSRITAIICGAMSASAATSSC